MKKIFAFAIASVALTVGCQKNEVIVDPTEDGTPVQLVLGSSVATLQTKAALDNFTGAEKLVIYGIDKSATDLSLAASYLVDSVIINSAASATEDITIANTFYGTAGQKYDFYGFYTGGAENGPVVKAADKITVPVKITGQEDLLIGKTTTPSDLEAKGLVAGDLYSAKSARKGVKPHLKFDHQLVRFDFKLVNGSDIPSDSDKTISVDKITVTSLAEGDLVIDPQAAANCKLVTSATAEDASLFIPSNGTGKLATFTKDNKADVTVGESLMVMPGKTEYPVSIVISQTGTGAPADTSESKLKIGTTDAAFTGFQAGFKYIVTIKVYGQEAVIVNVELAQWNDGGTFVLDPDGENTYTPPTPVIPEP